MSDGQSSGRSTGRVSCKSTELKRCSVIEMRWNKCEVSLASPVWTLIRRPSSEIKFRVVELKTPRFYYYYYYNYCYCWQRTRARASVWKHRAWRNYRHRIDKYGCNYSLCVYTEQRSVAVCRSWPATTSWSHAISRHPSRTTLTCPDVAPRAVLQRHSRTAANPPPSKHHTLELSKRWGFEKI